MQLPPTEALLEEIQEQLIIQELQLQRGEEFGIRISDGELNQTFIQIAANNGVSLEQFIRDYEASGQNYEKLREEIRRDMILLGCKSIKELNSSKIAYR
jgi:peptidyl-prolyl cis-trans isomerase SurA